MPKCHAEEFHRAAGEFLASHGFALSPGIRIGGKYGDNAALYRSARGLRLWVVFDPHDSGCAWMACGREWTPKHGASYLSNKYAALARRFGFSVPRSYSTERREPPAVFVRQLVADLERTLPTIVARMSIEDLYAIEQEEPIGASLCTAKGYGANYLKDVSVSEFLAEPDNPGAASD